MNETGYPPRQGLYDPQHEHDACGFGFVVDIKGRASHDIVQKALATLPQEKFLGYVLNRQGHPAKKEAAA